MNEQKCKNLRKFVKLYETENGELSEENWKRNYKKLKKVVKNSPEEYEVIKKLLKKLK